MTWRLAGEAWPGRRAGGQVGGRRRASTSMARSAPLQVDELVDGREGPEGARDGEDLLAADVAPGGRSPSSAAARGRSHRRAASSAVASELGVAVGVADAVPGDRVAVVEGVADERPARAAGLAGLVGQADAPRTGEVRRRRAQPGGQRGGGLGEQRVEGALGRAGPAPGGERRRPAGRTPRCTPRRRGWGTRRPARRSAEEELDARPRRRRRSRRSRWRCRAGARPPPAHRRPGPHRERSPSAPTTTRASTSHRPRRPSSARTPVDPARRRRGATPVTVTPRRRSAPASAAARATIVSRTWRRGATRWSTPARSLTSRVDRPVGRVERDLPDRRRPAGHHLVEQAPAVRAAPRRCGRSSGSTACRWAAGRGRARPRRGPGGRAAVPLPLRRPGRRRSPRRSRRGAPARLRPDAPARPVPRADCVRRVRP